MSTFNRKSAFSIDVRDPDIPNDTGSINCMIVLKDSLFTFSDNFISEMLTAETIDPENKHPDTRHSYQKIFSVGSANLCVARTIIQADSILKSVFLRKELNKQSILDHVWDCTKHLLSCEKALFSIYSDVMKLISQCDEIINEGKGSGHISPLPQVPDLEDKVGSFLANGKRFLEKSHELLCIFYGAPNSSSNFQAYREWMSSNQSEKTDVNRVLIRDEPWITRLALSRNAFGFNHSKEGNEVVLYNFRLHPGNKFTAPNWRYDFSKKDETEKQDHETDLIADLDTYLNNLLYFFEELYLTCFKDNFGDQFGFEIFSIEEDMINPKCPIAFRAIPSRILNKGRGEINGS